MQATKHKAFNNHNKRQVIMRGYVKLCFLGSGHAADENEIDWWLSYVQQMKLWHRHKLHWHRNMLLLKVAVIM